MNIQRDAYSHLVNDLRRHEVSIIIVPSQVGKIFVLKEQKSDARAKGLSTRYYNLELPIIIWLSESWNHYVKANYLQIGDPYLNI